MKHRRNFWLHDAFRRYGLAAGGNMGFALSLCALPMLLAAGVAVDYSRQIFLKNQLDAIADVVAVQAVDFTAMNQKIELAKADAAVQFAALIKANAGGNLESLSIDIANDKTGRVSTVSYKASLSASSTALFGSSKLYVAGKATAHSATPTNLDIYILADNTPSMGLGATDSDIARLEGLTANAKTASAFSGACAFACHLTGSTYDYYTIARDNGVTLRIDSVRNAVNSLLDTAQAAITPYVKFQFAMYTFGIDATNETLTNIYPLSSDLSGAKAAAAKINLMSTPKHNYKMDAITDMTPIFNQLNAEIPDSGSGETQDSSRKLLFFVSDGLLDALTPVCSVSLMDKRPGHEHCESPIDTSLCEQLKARGITIAAVYTTYLPMMNDLGYRRWIDRFNAGPFSPSPNSKIAQAMQACATTGYYQEVGPNDSIAATLNLLFNQFVVQSARITG